MKFPRNGPTCVRNHQPPSGMTKHRSCFVERPAGSQRDLRREEVFASSAQRRPHCDPSIVRSQAPWKCLRVGHDVVLRRLCHTYNERAVSLLHSLDQEKRQEHGITFVFQLQQQCRHTCNKTLLKITSEKVKHSMVSVKPITLQSTAR